MGTYILQKNIQVNPPCSIYWSLSSLCCKVFLKQSNCNNYNSDMVSSFRRYRFDHLMVCSLAYCIIYFCFFYCNLKKNMRCNIVAKVVNCRVIDSNYFFLKNNCRLARNDSEMPILFYCSTALDPAVMEHKTETVRSIVRSFTLDTLFLLLCYIDFPVWALHFIYFAVIL